MMRGLAIAALCLTVLATLTACGDYYEAATYPGSQFDRGVQ